MTPRKELFIAVKQALLAITQLELVDLDRGQMNGPEENYPDLFTAALIRISQINYTCMTEQLQEGTAQVEVRFYTRDGWMDQHQDTADPDHGLNEIDLLDTIAENLQHLHGNCFSGLHLSNEQQISDNYNRLVYLLSFDTTIHRRLNGKYTMQKLNLKHNTNGVFE